MKRDITPQQNEILELKKQTNELDSKLKHFNSLNSGLGLTVDYQRTKQEKVQSTITNSRSQIRRNDTLLRGYRKAVYDVAQNIDDFDQLKLSFHQFLFPFVADSKKKQEDVDKDITKEFKAQAKFLENSNKKLQYQLNQRQTLHKEDNLNIMNENVQLIADVTHLRNEVKIAKDRIKDIGGANALEKIKATQEAMNAAES